MSSCNAISSRNSARWSYSCILYYFFSRCDQQELRTMVIADEEANLLQRGRGNEDNVGHQVGALEDLEGLGMEVHDD